MIEQKKKRFKDTLQSAYDHKSYILFIRELLNDIQIVAPDKRIQTYDTFGAAVEHYYHIGNYVGDDKNKIALFSVCLKNDKSLENARSMQRAFIKHLLEKSNCTGALVAFYTEKEPDKWRLSLVRLDYEFSKGKLSEILTPAKRYSYLVGKDEPCHTALERLFPIFISDENNPGLDVIEEAFSVEAVTDDFFKQYREKYLELKEYLDNNEEFLAESGSRGFDSEQFAKKLMGQIVFLYFIQKKGWLGVDAFPVKLTKQEYNSAFYRRGQKPKEVLPIVYKQLEGGYYHRDSNALLSLSAEDECILSTIVKGDSWGSGPKDFVRRIFEGCIDANKNFFDDYLEPLFYTGLNIDRGENAFYQPFHRRIPFLNGGLFEELDGYDWSNNDFKIPNEFFSNKEKKDREADGLLDILDRYNFTMAEDEPMEREVAIDPEMLGKVFENLLDIKDRKSKGAYYTPREIVHYMCQESLINFIVTKTGIPEGDIRKFVLYGEYFCAEDARKTIPVDNKTGRVLQGQEVFLHEHHMEFDNNKELEIPETILSFKNDINRLKEIDDLLANIKVVDLAVGSGAFPLGMLNEIVKIRNIITSYMAIGLNRKDSFYLHSSRSLYFLKRNTIKNCLFACDIEPSAADITKLRLWLSLVIDNQIMKEDNELLGHATKPRPLPNLDCNIICGNSLVDEFLGVPLVTENSALGNFFSREQTLDVLGYDQILSAKINELIELQSQLYEAKEHISKETLKTQIQDIYDEIILEQLKVVPEAIDEYYQVRQLSSQPFILWQLYFPRVFRDNGGFDIVIGNPPYVGEKGNKELFRPIAATGFGKKYYCGKMDLFYFFFHKAIDLGNQYAEIAYITTNYYVTAYGAKKLREDIKERTQIRKLINFNEMKIFESAQGQHNMITMLSKSRNMDIICYNRICKKCGHDKRVFDAILYETQNTEEYFDCYYVEQNNLFEGPENYLRLQGCTAKKQDSIESILEKLSSSDILLKDIALIKQGIVSGADKYTDAHEKKYRLGFPKGKGIFVFVNLQSKCNK